MCNEHHMLHIDALFLQKVTSGVILSVLYFILGTAVVQIQAQYPDGSRSGIGYSIFSGNKLQSFSISSTTGKFATRVLNTHLKSLAT